MKKTTLLLAATAALTLGAGAASAQVWLPIIEREAIVNERIDAGLANGEISAGQASLMRSDMASLVALEGRYRWGGLSAREKLDLDRRFALVDDRIRLAMADGATPRLAALEDRKLEIESRIDAGVRSGQLTSAEARALRDDFDAIANVEADYEVGGVSPSERADLLARLDDLGERIHVARTDDDRVYGYNRY